MISQNHSNLHVQGKYRLCPKYTPHVFTSCNYMHGYMLSSDEAYL